MSTYGCATCNVLWYEPTPPRGRTSKCWVCGGIGVDAWAVTRGVAWSGGAQTVRHGEEGES